MLEMIEWTALALAAFVALSSGWSRLALSRAKHPSLAGHSNWSRRLARLLPYYAYDEQGFFGCDNPPPKIRDGRSAGFARLAGRLSPGGPPRGDEETLERGVSDLQFTSRYRAPFQFAAHLSRHLAPNACVERSSGVMVTDLDGRSAYDLTGSYGVNLFGYDFYKSCIEEGHAAVRDLGPLLGMLHPIVADNVRRLQAISGLDEVSFHMSGTEAVMQAVRLARFHTGRTHLVRFCGAYHGWWDDVQPGVGTPVPVSHTYTLRDMDARTLRVLDTRTDIACVLVNPVQVLHPNRSAPGDGTLVGSRKGRPVDRARYMTWLTQLREVCDRRGIVLIMDEVFVGFRLARGGAQEYFGVRADMVTYGKTLGGGLPVGVLCGAARYMKRFREGRPSDICFARGTFNSHPYVMGAMNAFLRRLDQPEIAATYVDLDARWNARVRALNDRLAKEQLPVSVTNLVSIWTVHYDRPSRYNWMFQYYLRAEGLALSWIGTGRFIFSHNYSDADVAVVMDRFVAAARAMRDDGWWWHPRHQTDRTIARSIAWEMLTARVRKNRVDQAALSVTIGSNSSPRST